MRNLSSEFSLLVFVDTILTPSELDAYFTKREHAQIADCIREYADGSVSLRKFASAGADGAAKGGPSSPIVCGLSSSFCKVSTVGVPFF